MHGCLAAPSYKTGTRNLRTSRTTVLSDEPKQEHQKTTIAGSISTTPHLMPHAMQGSWSGKGRSTASLDNWLAMDQEMPNIECRIRSAPLRCNCQHPPSPGYIVSRDWTSGNERNTGRGWEPDKAPVSIGSTELDQL